jgi:hypothetical protein
LQADNDGYSGVVGGGIGGVDERVSVTQTQKTDAGGTILAGTALRFEHDVLNSHVVSVHSALFYGNVCELVVLHCVICAWKILYRN